MASFGWAYVDCAGTDGSGSSGPPSSVQFVTESGGATTGSWNLTYHTAAYLGYEPSTMVLTGNLYVTGTVSASIFHIEDIAIIDATGSTFFGDDLQDTHQRSGSLIISGPPRGGKHYVLSASTAQERAWVRGFGGRYARSTGGLYTIKDYDYVIGCSASGDQTLLLPTASTVGAGTLLIIKDEWNNRAATSIYISASQHGTPHQRIDDEIYYHLTGTMPAISLYSDGSNWFVF